MSTGPGLTFSLLNASSTTRFGPRLGTAILHRNEKTDIQIQTPNFLASTSRGLIPHLSRDHYESTSIRWINIPFESFIDVLPPVPTLVPGKNPLHTFLGYTLGQHIVSMSLRDPLDVREMPPNGNAHVAAYSLQGVRKVSPPQWKSYAYACKPDVVFALTDTPFTNPPYSQKRLTKSIERSASWLAHMIAPPPPHESEDYRPGIIVHMAGGASIPARGVFAESLVEKLHGPEAETVKPLETLDGGVLGYSFDLAHIKISLDAAEKKHQDPPPLVTVPDPLVPSVTKKVEIPDPDAPIQIYPPDQLPPLLHASLDVLPTTKLRLANSVQTPHEILFLISSVGIDLFDAFWVQKAADIGVALDFTFPITSPSLFSSTQTSPGPVCLKKRDNGKLDIGHNIYDSIYAHDFSPLSSSSNDRRCPCLACAPLVPSMRIYHGADDPSYTGEEPTSPTSDSRVKPSFTCAYVHHLLHTHEMSAHSLLVLHNIAVLDGFFSGIRGILGNGSREEWDEEVRKFGEVYDEKLSVFEEARMMWRDVDLARGKGRLAREKKKLEEERTVGGTTVDA